MWNYGFSSWKWWTRLFFTDTKHALKGGSVILGASALACMSVPWALYKFSLYHSKHHRFNYVDKYVVL